MRTTHRLATIHELDQTKVNEPRHDMVYRTLSARSMKIRRLWCYFLYCQSTRRCFNARPNAWKYNTEK